jgi:hypothetical protein
MPSPFYSKSPNKLFRFHKWKQLQPRSTRVEDVYNYGMSYTKVITPAARYCLHCDERQLRYHIFWVRG